MSKSEGTFFELNIRISANRPGGHIFEGYWLLQLREQVA